MAHTANQGPTSLILHSWPCPQQPAQETQQDHSFQTKHVAQAASRASKRHRMRPPSQTQQAADERLPRVIRISGGDDDRAPPSASAAATSTAPIDAGLIRAREFPSSSSLESTSAQKPFRRVAMTTKFHYIRRTPIPVCKQRMLVCPS